MLSRWLANTANRAAVPSCHLLSLSIAPCIFMTSVAPNVTQTHFFFLEKSPTGGSGASETDWIRKVLCAAACWWSCAPEPLCGLGDPLHKALPASVSGDGRQTTSLLRSKPLSRPSFIVPLSALDQGTSYLPLTAQGRASRCCRTVLK